MAKNVRSGRESKKVNVSIDSELLQKIDEYADSHYMSRSAFFTYASSQILLSDKVYKLLDDLSVVMKDLYSKISSNPDYVASDDDVREMERIENTFALLSGEYLKNKGKIK